MLTADGVGFVLRCAESPIAESAEAASPHQQLQPSPCQPSPCQPSPCQPSPTQPGSPAAAPATPPYLVLVPPSASASAASASATAASASASAAAAGGGSSPIASPLPPRAFIRAPACAQHSSPLLAPRVLPATGRGGAVTPFALGHPEQTNPSHPEQTNPNQTEQLRSAAEDSLLLSASDVPSAYTAVPSAPSAVPSAAPPQLATSPISPSPTSPPPTSPPPTSPAAASLAAAAVMAGTPPSSTESFPPTPSVASTPLMAACASPPPDECRSAGAVAGAVAVAVAGADGGRGRRASEARRDERPYETAAVGGMPIVRLTRGWPPAPDTHAPSRGPAPNAVGGGKEAASPRALIVEIFMAPARWAELPEALRGGQVIKCVVALISLGINAQQSVANAVGHAELQEIINCRTLDLLRRYHDAYRQLRLSTALRLGDASDAAATYAHVAPLPPLGLASAFREAAMVMPGGASAAVAEGRLGAFEREADREARSRVHPDLLAELRRLHELMIAVEATVLRSVTYINKNTEVIALTERLVRELGGGRITSCKSGKDRTSMAVTAEQARVLHERHGVSEAEANELLDAMRSHGVRWLNMRKNMGALGQYAFNWLQQRLLPEGYRAPKGTYTQIFNRSVET